MKINFLYSIKSKLVLLICAMSLFALIITSSVFYYFVYSISTEQAKEHIENETNLISLRFGELFRTIKNDVSMLLMTPPIQGIIRSKNNNGIDDIGKSTLEQWRNRLENIFLAVMQNNDSYMQIRYIGLQDEGREIVRVNRDLQNRNSLRIVASKDMQSKKNEPYFIDATKLKENDVYISSVTYNREHGKITQDNTSMIRVIKPVFNGKFLFGFIIINVNYPEFFKKITNELSPSTSLMVINSDGSYFQYDHENKKYLFSNSDDEQTDSSKYVKYGQSLEKNNGSYIDEHSYTYYVKNIISDNSTGGVQYFFTALQINNSELFAKSNYMLKFIVLLMLVITAMKLLVGYLFSNRLIAPLTKITQELHRYSPAKGKDLKLPINRQDEIGLLSRSFNEMINEIEQFIYTASHDLKQPLRNISSYISFLKEDCYKYFNEQGKKYISGLENSITRMNTLISELLTYSRIGSNKNQSKVDLNDVLNDVLQDLNSAIRSKQAKIEYDRLPIIIGNKIDLHSLFQNLLDNSIKYSKENTDLCISISVKSDSKYHIIEFKDNGIGIDKLYHTKIFELFQRVCDYDSLDGSGIGLAHCKKIVEQHHGSIKVDSQLNQGCTFIISLPKANAI